MTAEREIIENSQKLVTETNVKFKSLCVAERGNGKFYYPPSIPKERSGHTKYICILLCIVLSTVDYFTNSLDIYTFIGYYSFGFLGIFLYNLLYRFILICEELNHIKTRYDNSYGSLLKDTFTFSIKIFITLTLCIFIIVIRGYHGIFITPNMNFILYFAPTIFLGEKILNMNASPLNSSLQIANINGLDYGSGMAYSYYHGYLKLILPDTGTEDKNLKELMEIYEGEHGVKFAAYKLFILIPVSLRCWVSLKNDFSPSVDESHTIREKQITVAGVQNRVYKNSVYKITCGPNKKVYVSAEYASPLKTYNDVVTGSGHHAKYYGKYKNDITIQFFLTLQKILKHNHYDECVEIIFFEDSYVNEENKTCYHDVGKILLARLKDLKKTQKIKDE